jgi:hypothetical protein
LKQNAINLCYIIENKCNVNSENFSTYKVSPCPNQKMTKHLCATIKKVGGFAIVTETEMIIKIPNEYWNVLEKHYELNCIERTEPLRIKTSLNLTSGSPLQQVDKAEILSLLNKLTPDIQTWKASSKNVFWIKTDKDTASSLTQYFTANDISARMDKCVNEAMYVIQLHSVNKDKLRKLNSISEHSPSKNLCALNKLV